MRPEDELQRLSHNEIDQQFAFHNMERNMAEAHRNWMRPISAKEMRAKRQETLFGLAAILVVLTGLGFMLAAAFGLI